jgi:hypothetical protein
MSMYIELCKVCLCQLEQRTNFLEEGGYCSVNTSGLSFPFIFDLKACWTFESFDVPRAPDVWKLTPANNTGPPWGNAGRGGRFVLRVSLLKPFAL